MKKWIANTVVVLTIFGFMFFFVAAVVFNIIATAERFGWLAAFLMPAGILAFLSVVIWAANNSDLTN